MKLREYLNNKGIKIKFFASQMGVDTSYVSNWMAGKKIPRKESMKKIEELTGGKVRPNDWFTE